MSVVHVSKESLAAASLRVGHGTATTTESQIGPNPWTAYKGFHIKAAAANTANILVGVAGDAVDGYVLAAGEEVFIPVDNSSALGIVAASATQSYSFWSI
jgi:hypothetical protein